MAGKPPKVAAPPPSSGSTHRLRCELPNSPESPSEIEKNAGPTGPTWAPLKGIMRNKRRKLVAEFRLPLTDEMIKADFIAMTGSKLPRRPKNQRPKAVEDCLDSLVPGSSFPKILAPHVDSIRNSL